MSRREVEEGHFSATQVYLNNPNIAAHAKTRSRKNILKQNLRVFA